MRARMSDVHLCPMETPSDVAAVRALLDDDGVDPHEVVALIGKSEGTGLGKDPGREAADHALRDLMAARLGVAPDKVADRVCLILSGGTPGVLTPHVAVVTRRWIEVDELPPGGRLAVGRARSRPIRPEEVGRSGQIGAVADAVRAAMHDAGVVDPADVHAVMVKAPSLSAETLEQARSRGVEPVTTDLSIGPEGAICYSNDASALGAGVALGEIPPEAIHDGVVRRAWNLYSEVAMTSSGGEKSHAEVLLLANSSHAAGLLRIGHRPMVDLLDADAVSAAMRDAAQGEDEIEPVYVLAKMIIPGCGRLRGRRITLIDDPVGYHVAKAMGGYMIAATTGQTMAFVSGGERNSHQGPPGGNPVAAIVRLPPHRKGR